MGFTYTAGSTANRDRVRLEIGDVDSSRALFSDEELDDLLTQETAVLASAARACEILAVRFARDYSFSADGFSAQKGTLSQAYSLMARRLRSRARGTVTVTPQRKDAYSDDIPSDQATIGSGIDFERGRFDPHSGRL